MRCPWWDFDSLQYRDLSFYVAPIHGHRASTHLMWSGKNSETSRQYIIQHGWLGPALWVYNAHIRSMYMYVVLLVETEKILCNVWLLEGDYQYSTDINSVAMCVFPCLFLMETLGLCTPAADLSGDQAQSEEDSLLELTQVLHLALFGNWTKNGKARKNGRMCVFMHRCGSTAVV